MGSKHNPLFAEIAEIKTTFPALSGNDQSGRAQRQHVASLQLSDNTKVSFIATENLPIDPNVRSETFYVYTTIVEDHGKKTEITAELNEGGKRLHVKGADGKECHFDNQKVQNSMAAAIKAFKTGTFTAAEATQLKTAQEKLLGAIKESKISADTSNLDSDQTPAVIAAYDKLRTLGKRGL